MKSIGFFFSCALLLAAACSGHTAEIHASVNGTFAGAPLAVTGTAAFRGTTAGTAYLGEVLADTANVCGMLQQNSAKANGSALFLLVQTAGGSYGSPTPVGPGNYTITNGAPAVDTRGTTLIVSATYVAVDARCQPTIADTTSHASAGTVVIHSVEGNVDGTFDLTFPNGDHLTGDFDSPTCAFDYAALQTPQSICQP